MSVLIMKTLILLLFTTFAFSQPYVSAGVDIRNATLGSEPTNFKPAFDGIFRIGAIGNQPFRSTTLDVVVGYEVFNRIGFDRYFTSIGVHFPLKTNYKNQASNDNKITIVPAYEFSIINRWGSDWGVRSSHLAVLGANLGIRYKLSDRTEIEFLTALLDRVDLNTMYGGRTLKISKAVTYIIKL